MQRPGFLGNISTIQSRRSGLGFFGKGKSVSVGIPGPPPPSFLHPVPAEYRGGRWVCDSPKPAMGGGGKGKGKGRGRGKGKGKGVVVESAGIGKGFYAHCCASGWVAVAYGDTQPCKGTNRALEICGPLPEGAVIEEAVCCEGMREWLPHTPGDPDPCRAAALASGRAIPGMTETILAEDISFDPDAPLMDSTMMIVAGVSALGLIGLTVFIMMRR